MRISPLKMFWWWWTSATPTFAFVTSPGSATEKPAARKAAAVTSLKASRCSTGFAPRNFCFYPEQAPLKSPWQKMAKRIAAVHAKHSLLDDRVASVLDLLDEA